MDFRKTGNRSQIAHEVAGLRWLADTPSDAVAIIPLLDVGPTWLVEPRLVETRPTADDARAFGAALAHTHAAGAPGLGAAPPGAPPGDGWIGRARLPLLGEAGSHLPWGDYYSQYRIRPYMDAAFSAEQRQTIVRFCELLESGALDHPEPALVRAPAARLHGDLWNGNVLWTPRGATLIDPAAQGGHAEDDLGALSLFGAPFLEEILDAYNAVSPLAPGWQGRLPLHQMHLLMVHAQVFGGTYLNQTAEVAAQILRANDN